MTIKNSQQTSDLFRYILEYSPQYNQHRKDSYDAYLGLYKETKTKEFTFNRISWWFRYQIVQSTPIMIFLVLFSLVFLSFGGAYAATKTPYIKDIQFVQGLDNRVIKPIEGFFTDTFVEELGGRKVFDVQNVLYQIDQEDSQLIQYDFDPCYLSLTYPQTTNGKESRGLQYREDPDVHTLVINPEDSSMDGGTSIAGGDFSISCSRTQASYKQGGVKDYPQDKILEFLPGWGINPAHVSEVLLDTFESSEYQTVFHFRLTQTYYKVTIPHAPGVQKRNDISNSFAEKVIFNYPREGDEWFKSRRRLGDEFNILSKVENQVFADPGCNARYTFNKPGTSIYKSVRETFYYGDDGRGPQTLVPSQERWFTFRGEEVGAKSISFGDLSCYQNTTYLYNLRFSSTSPFGLVEVEDTSKISFLSNLFDETTKVFYFENSYDEGKEKIDVYWFYTDDLIYSFSRKTQTESPWGPSKEFDGFIEVDKL